MLTGGGGGTVSASGIGAIKTDLANAPTTIVNANTTANDVGLGNVPNKTEAQLLAGNLTGTIGGTAVATVKTGAAAGATANQDDTATILGGTLTGNVSGTVGGTAVATIKSGAALGASSNQDTTSAIRAGTTAANVGLGSVVNQAITVASGKIKFDGNAQTIDADKVGGKTVSEAEAAAASAAETNILDGAPAGLQTLNDLAAALGDDASFATTTTNAIATKGPAPLTLTAEDVDGDATFSSAANTPSNLVVGQVGIFGGNQYVIVDV